MGVIFRARIAHQTQIRQLGAPAARTACATPASRAPTAVRVCSVVSARTKQARVMRLVNHALAILFRPLAARAQVTVYVHFRWLNQGRVPSQPISNLGEKNTHARCWKSRNISAWIMISVRHVRVRVHVQIFQEYLSVRARLASTKMCQALEHAQSAQRTLFRPRAAP